MKYRFRLTAAALVLLAASLAAHADIYINTGGPAMAGFAADNYSLGGYVYGSGNTIYASQRYNTGSPLRYEIPVANGEYDVTLHWQEIYFRNPGERLFDAVVEGVDIGYIDVYAIAKDQPYTRTVHVTVNDGTVSISLTGAVQNPFVSGISVVATTSSGTGGGSAPPPAPTLSLAASPTSVTSGSNSTLTWSSTAAISCTASGAWSGAKGTSGSLSVGPFSATSTFALSCTGSGGSVQKSATVTVTAAPSPAPTVSLSANPTSVTSGSNSTLTWISANATSCTAANGWSGSKAVSGSQSVGSLSATTTFALSCSGSGGSASKSVTVSVSAASPPPPDAVFPLHTESGKRYLIDNSGKPFLIQGDSPWDLFATLTREQAGQYLDDRRAKGFNTLLIELMEHKFSPNPPRNAYGDAPFLTAGDYSTPNEAYFANVAAMIDMARQRGMLLLITPSYVGYGGGDEGWYAEMQANGATKLRAFGQYLANRFSAYPNILWVQGGDYTPPDRSLLDAIPNGIRDSNTSWLHTFHGPRHSSALGVLGTSTAWLGVNDIYTDNTDVVSSAFTEYNRSTMPFFLIEAYYEGEYGAADLTVRQQAYQAVLSGATGQIFGNNPVWYFGSGWQTQLNSASSTTLPYLRSLLEARSWWLLQPDTGGTLVTSGTGSGQSRTAAARASDGSYALVYVPSGRSIAVNIARLAGPRVNVRWYNPRTGAYSAISGSPFTASGTQTLTSSSGDWVLVLESTQ